MSEQGQEQHDQDVHVATIDSRMLHAAAKSAGADQTRPTLCAVAVWCSKDEAGGDRIVTAATNTYSLVVLWSGMGWTEEEALQQLREKPTAMIPTDMLKQHVGKEPFVMLWRDTWRTAYVMERVDIHGRLGDVYNPEKFPRLWPLIPAIPTAVQGHEGMYKDGDVLLPLVNPFAFTPGILDGLSGVSSELERGIKLTKEQRKTYKGMHVVVRYAPPGNLKPFVVTGLHDPVDNSRCRVGVYWLQMPVRVG